MAGDVTDASFPDRLVKHAVETFGSIDIIVNNAGYTWDSVIQKTTDEQFRAMLDVHLMGPFRVLRAASNWIREKAKRESTEGVRVMRKVVNITSISGTDGNPGQVGYSSGKAGVIGMTKTLAKEWGRYNVNVNAVGFGLIETRLIQPITGEGAKIRDQGSPDQRGCPAEGAGKRQSFVSARETGHAGGSGERGPFLLLAAVRLRYRRGADL